MNTTCTECGGYIFSLSDRDHGSHLECRDPDLVQELQEKTLEDQLDTLLEQP